jgi:hypothetical protein
MVLSYSLIPLRWDHQLEPLDLTEDGRPRSNQQSSPVGRTTAAAVGTVVNGEVPPTVPEDEGRVYGVRWSSAGACA